LTYYLFEISQIRIRYYNYEGDIILNMFDGNITIAFYTNKLRKIYF